MEEQEKQPIEFELNVQNLEKLIYSRRRKLTSYTLLLLASMFSLFGLIFSLYGIINEEHYGNKRYKKQEIQSKLSVTIQRGGSMDLVKHIYAARQYKNYNIADFFHADADEYYYEPTSLSFILNDLLVEAYQNELYTDSVYLNHLNRILIEHERKNPFDDLEESQRASFENILVKLGDNYEIIQPDVSKLASEVNTQNKLVYKYLNKSTNSYIISIIALVITIIASTYQIYQAKKTNDLLKNAISLPKE